MNTLPGGANGPRRRSGKNSFTTRSGKTIRVHQSIGEKRRATKAVRAEEHAAYLSTLPKNKWKRILYRMHPKRVAQYWFSRKGAIMALKLAGLSIILTFVLIVGVFAYFRKDLPKINDISGQDLGGSITYYDRTGQTVLWQDYDAVKRVAVPGDKISPYMKQATIAIEDKDFYKHGAFDTRGIMRAAINDVFGSGGTQGGSTITQQLVKLSQQWTNDRTITRKVKEVILAVDLEREYSKDDILSGYLNIAPYGGVDYGAETAARDYFGKGANELTLAEATTLAAIPKAPAYYSPYSPSFDKESLLGRQHYILDQMVAQGYIKKADAEAAKNVDVVASVKPQQPKYQGIKAPYFVLAAKAQLEKKYGATTVNRGGWSVVTTLDLTLQADAEDQVAKGMAQIRRQGGDSAAFAATDVETGQIVALVGGSDFTNTDYGQFNFAQTNLPPGSSFKPYDYAALIESSTNVGAGTVLYDQQGKIDGYPCDNKQRPKDGGNCLWDYDFRYPGPVTIRYALGGSRNVPAVKAMLITGVDKTINTANKLMTGNADSGYKCYRSDLEDIANATKNDESSCYASSAIGDGAYLHLDDHITGYATISRGGDYLAKTYILKITDASNHVIDEWKKPKGKQVIRPDTAYIMADMMSDPNASYFPAARKPQRYTNAQGVWHFAMKTGTTNDAKDGWMMGYSTKYAAGVWVGYHTRQVAMTGTMEDMTQPIWQGWMRAAHKELKPVTWTKPTTIKTAPAYVIRSHVGIGSVEPSPATDLVPSWYVAQSSNGSSKTIDKVSNKVATSCTPSLAKIFQSNGNDNGFSADIFVTGSRKTTASATTTATDDVHNCNDDKPSVILTAPSSCSKANDCNYTITVQQGTHPLTSSDYVGKVNLLANGNVVKSVDIPADSGSVYTTTVSYYGDAGGNASVTAQVIDSVLYDNSSTGSTVNFTSSGGNSNSGGGNNNNNNNDDD